MQIPPEMMNRPLGGDHEKYPVMPEREWLSARIVDATCEFDEFNGKPVYVQDRDTKQNKLDSEGNPIRRIVYKIKYELKKGRTEKGNPLSYEIKLGATFGDNSHLPRYLKLLGIEFPQQPAPIAVVNALKGLDVKIQLTNKESKKGNIYQNAVWDAIKLDKEPTATDKAWDELEEKVKKDEIQWDV